jgi:hypothetical protein
VVSLDSHCKRVEVVVVEELFTSLDVTPGPHAHFVLLKAVAERSILADLEVGVAAVVDEPSVVAAKTLGV